jgi:hypothetical protein
VYNDCGIVLCTWMYVWVRNAIVRYLKFAMYIFVARTEAWMVTVLVSEEYNRTQYTAENHGSERLGIY